MNQEPIQPNYIELFRDKIAAKTFPCVGARAALQKEQLCGLQAGHLACPQDDQRILNFLYDFIDRYRERKQAIFHSAFVVFDGPEEQDASRFEQLFWHRLQQLADIDAQQYGYDARVSKNPASANFSFSLKEEAFFLVALHPAAERPARQFPRPVIVFNPHDQFEEMRKDQRFDKLKNIIRQRDLAVNGSINPMLQDYGNRSEIFQYTGMKHDASWKCPLHLKHG